MLIVAALGGNALLRRGEPLTHAVQQRNIRAACAALAPVAARHRLVVTHGNGPQIGLLALEDEAAGHFPLDVLGAETEGMIGYLLEQELRNRLPGRETATLLTQVVVAADDPAFERPSKPVGPVYTEAEAERVRTEHGWTVARDGAGYRRVVPSPQPLDVISLDTIELLLHSGRLVICGGGGGIPVITRPDGTSSGVEAVIDKDLLAALLAIRLRADLLLILTDVDGVVRGYGSPGATPIAEISTAKLRRLDFEAGSMGPKVEAACRFVEHTGARAAIGSLSDAEALVVGSRGTQVRPPRSSAFTPGRVRAVSLSSG
jgi:carbamate kinase